MNAAEEQAYLRGSRAAWQQQLRTCLRELTSSDEPLDAARLLLEREEAVATLRQLCAVFGDNDWEPTAHLADVIDKHLDDIYTLSARSNK